MKNGSKNSLTSGDRLVNWLFKRLIDICNKRVFDVRLRKFAKGKIRKICKFYYDDNDCPAQLGEVDLDDGNENDISIEYRISKRAKGRVFVHELAHILFKESIGQEKFIEQFENILWPRFSEAQKQEFIERAYLLIRSHSS